MNATINKVVYLIAVSAIIWAILATKGCNDKAADIASVNAYTQSLKDSILGTIKAKDGLETRYKLQVTVDKNTLTQIISENTSLKKTLSDMKVKIGNIQAVSQVETKIQLVHDTIPLKRDTLKLHDTIKNQEVSFCDSNKNYIIEGFANPKQLIFTQLSFKDSSTVVSESQGGLFKKESYILKISHSNPYVNTTGIESLIIKPQKKWYQTKAVIFGAGIVGGIITYKILLK